MYIYYLAQPANEWHNGVTYVSSLSLLEDWSHSLIPLLCPLTGRPPRPVLGPLSFRTALLSAGPFHPYCAALGLGVITWPGARPLRRLNQTKLVFHGDEFCFYMFCRKSVTSANKSGVGKLFVIFASCKPQRRKKNNQFLTRYPVRITCCSKL